MDTHSLHRTKCSDVFSEGHSSYSPEDILHMWTAMRWSLGIGFLMLAIKSFAYVITGSAAILSDAAESVVHVLAVSFATYSFRLSLKPPDETHMYGHDRISFFSAGFEGAMIIVAAIFIIYEAVEMWVTGLTARNLGPGTTITAIAMVINAALGWYLVRQGRKYNSIVLEANGKHVLTDSWTSVGVILGLTLVIITGWLPFDPILAIVVACNILWTGMQLIRKSIGGLMDESNPETDARLRALFEEATAKRNVRFHGLRHRNAGNKILVEVHLLFPNNISIAEAHEQATLIEREIHKAFPSQLEVLTHLEPVEGHDEIHEKLLRT